MSWSERSVRHQKRQTDCAISHAYAPLASDAPAVAKFHESLHYVRKRAPRMLEAPVLNGHHPGVEALINLSRFGSAHIRPVAEWSGTTSSWRLAVSSLAHHLVCKYEVPVFLASSWYSTEDAAGDKKRGWFVAHARGSSFRSLNLPIAMTRKMEHIFLASPDHLAFEHAIRRAELLAPGAPSEFVLAVLATRLATDLSNGMFWRTVWLFLIANAGIIDPAQIGRNRGAGPASAGVFNKGANRKIDATFDGGLASKPWRGQRLSRMDTLAITSDATGRAESGRFCSAEAVADDRTHQ